MKSLETGCWQRGHGGAISAALVCLGKGVYRLRGTPRMHERPQARCFKLAPARLPVDSPNEKLPAVIHGTGPRPANAGDIGESSQFCERVADVARCGRRR